jgi:Rab GTPase-activating protein 1
LLLAFFLGKLLESLLDHLMSFYFLIADNDEPMLSGTGDVSKDCSEAMLEQWAETLTKWTQSGSRPKQLVQLVRQGIPDALRAEVWQRLAGDSDDVMDQYRILISKESSCESVIQRDISRTFPAHDFFKVCKPNFLYFIFMFC